MEIQYSFNNLDLYTLDWIDDHISLNVIYLSMTAQVTRTAYIWRTPQVHTKSKGAAPTEREH